MSIIRENKAIGDKLKRKRGLAPKIRVARLEDYEQIAMVLARNGLTIRPHDEWVSYWLGNPVYEERADAWPIGWVLEERDTGEIVGSISNVPLAYNFEGATLIAGAASAWAVDPLYRGFSLVLLQTLTNQPGADLTISTTVSANAEPAYLALQWSRAPVGVWDQASFWITNHSSFCRNVLDSRKIPFASALAYPAGGLLFCWDWIRSPRARVGQGEVTISELLTFDSRFDGFWEAAREQNKSVLLPVRSRRTLEWHFRYALARREACILGAFTGNDLIGYAVFDRLDHPTWSMKRVRLVDLQALRDRDAVANAAVAWMLRRCQKDGIDILETVGGWCPPAASAQVRVLHTRKLSSWSYYYRASSKDLAAQVGSPKVWSVSSFDGDASI